MNNSGTNHGFSSSVQMELRTPYGAFPLTHTDSESVMLAAPRSIPACDAEIAISIDGQEYSWSARLPQVAVADNPRVPTCDSQLITAAQRPTLSE